MRKLIITLVVLVVIAVSVGAYYNYGRTVPPPVVTTVGVTRGDIVDAVGATGTLQAVTTVQVGTQVSGTISELNADFNSLVHRGEVVARLDPSLFQTQLEQSRANLVRSQADLQRLAVSLDDARTKLKRAQELSKRSLIPQTDLETAQVNVNAADAQLRSAQAQVTQAQASLNQSQVNLDHTIITAPIDGIVISRNVDVGQTVAASMQAPTLFVLAADLTKMQVVASLDESDVGRIRPGQPVSFRVDAYPTEEFSGTVSQVRLQPQVVQNVVTYSTVIAVPNPELKLKPGMTANVSIEIARRTNVVRIPTVALRFRPTNEIYAALGQTPEPAAPQRGTGGGAAGQRSAAGAGRSSAGPGPAAAAIPSPPASQRPAATTQPSPQAQRRMDSGAGGQGIAGGGGGQASGGQPSLAGTEARGGAVPGSNGPASDARARQNSAPPGEAGTRPGGSGGGGFRGAGGGSNGGSGDFAARMQNLSPEERAARLEERMRSRGGDPAAAQAAPAAARPQRSPAPPAQSPSLSTRNPQATTIDALFGPLPPVETTGRVWLHVNGQLRPVRLRLGISDGQATELLEGAIEPGAELVTNVSTGEAVRSTAGGMGMFPMMGGQPGRGGMPGGGAPGGGRPAGGGGQGR
jgi:HlyD family secretion protein